MRRSTGNQLVVNVDRLFQVGRNGFWLVLFFDASVPSRNNAGEGDGNEFDSPREGNGGRGGQVRKGKKSR